MEKLRITGVPEHFNYPWKQVVAGQPFLDAGVELEWINEPRGSGAMNKALRDGSTDLAIVLTESFIKDKIEGNPAGIIGLHVNSPLVWGIHASGKTVDKNLQAFSESPFVISRVGSGSHLMAFLLAKREDWPRENLRFEPIGDLNGAVEWANKGESGLFLWEKYTTQPLVENRILVRIGEIPTPWPCFVLTALPEAVLKFGSLITSLRDLVYQNAFELRSTGNLAGLISKAYGLDEVGVESWLAQTIWAKNNKLKSSDIELTQNTLFELGLIGKKMAVEKFMLPGSVQLVGG